MEKIKEFFVLMLISSILFALFGVAFCGGIGNFMFGIIVGVIFFCVLYFLNELLILLLK